MIKDTQLTIILLGVIAMSVIITINQIPTIVEYESIVLALVALISTIVGGLIGFLHIKPTPKTTDMTDSIIEEGEQMS